MNLYIKPTAAKPPTETQLGSTNKHKYKSLYKWMIIPMIIMQLGIFRDYWGDFTDNA